jgi:hypothetical protein
MAKSRPGPAARAVRRPSPQAAELLQPVEPVMIPYLSWFKRQSCDLSTTQTPCLVRAMTVLRSRRHGSHLRHHDLPIGIAVCPTPDRRNAAHEVTAATALTSTSAPGTARPATYAATTSGAAPANSAAATG